MAFNNARARTVSDLDDARLALNKQAWAKPASIGLLLLRVLPDEMID